MFSSTAAANTSARGPRVAILASPLADLIGFCLAVDCLTRGCSGERTFAMTDLATFYGDKTTVGEVVCAEYDARAAVGAVLALRGW